MMDSDVAKRICGTDRRGAHIKRQDGQVVQCAGSDVRRYLCSVFSGGASFGDESNALEARPTSSFASTHCTGYFDHDIGSYKFAVEAGTTTVIS